MSEHAFDRAAWNEHWATTGDASPASPVVAQETAGLAAGSALDAGCGTGADALVLATRGWSTTGVDIARAALDRAAAADPDAQVRWIEADLTDWSPERPFDLVTTSYAHAAIPQLELYERLAGWVAPGGTLLIVGHAHGSATRHGDTSPEEAVVTPETVAALLPPDHWRIETAETRARTAPGSQGGHHLQDVVVRATRLRPSAQGSTPGTLVR